MPQSYWLRGMHCAIAGKADEPRTQENQADFRPHVAPWEPAHPCIALLCRLLMLGQKQMVPVLTLVLQLQLQQHDTPRRLLGCMRYWEHQQK